MGSDAQGYGGWSGGYNRGLSGFGPGGGSYDQEWTRGYGSGAGHTGGVNYGHEGRLTRGYGGDFYSGGSFGYNTGGGMRDYNNAGSGGGYGGGVGRGGSDWETGGGMGNDWGARDTGYGGGMGTGRGGMSGGTRGGQDETRRLRAVDIMTENPETVTPDTSLADAAVKMRDLNVGIIPVVDSEQGRRLRGVVTDRDIAIRAVAEGMDARSTRVQEVMTTEVESCNKNDSVADILRVMEREQVRRVPITDREGRLVGIVAQADVVLDVDTDRGELRVSDAIERISEPTGRGGYRGGSQGRGGSYGGGGMQGGGWSGGGMGGSGNRSGGMTLGGGQSGRTTPRSGAEGMGASSNQGGTTGGGTEFGAGSSNVGGLGMNDTSGGGGENV
jgi:CBS domain-containing protein